MTASACEQRHPGCSNAYLWVAPAEPELKPNSGRRCMRQHGVRRHPARTHRNDSLDECRVTDRSLWPSVLANHAGEHGGTGQAAKLPAHRYSEAHVNHGILMSLALGRSLNRARRGLPACAVLRGLVLLALVIIGCAGPRGLHLYPGPPRGEKELAAVKLDGVVEVQEFVGEDGKQVRVAQSSQDTLFLLPGQYTFLLRTPAQIVDCRAQCLRSWKLKVNLQSAHQHFITADARVYEVMLDAQGNGCAARADISGVRLEEPGSGSAPIEAEMVNEAERTSLTNGQPTASAPKPAAPEGTTPRAEAEVAPSIEDFGEASSPQRDPSRTSGAVISVVFLSAGRLEVTKRTVAAILADGSRLAASLGFTLDASSNVEVLMLSGATMEGMTVGIHGRSYDAFGTMARMAGHLGDTEGWGFEGRPGDKLKIGVVFDSPASAVRSLEVFGTTLPVDSQRPAQPSMESGRAVGKTSGSAGRLFRLTAVLSSYRFDAKNYPGKLAAIDLSTHRGTVIKVKARPEKGHDTGALLPLSTADFLLAFELDGKTASVPCIGFRFGDDRWVLADDGEANLHFNLSITEPELLFLVPLRAAKAKLVQNGPNNASLAEFSVQLPSAP